MKLEDQVCSLELAKRLKEFGVKQESIFHWMDDGYGHINPKNYAWDNGRSSIASAFTVAELGEMLPYVVDSSKYQLTCLKGLGCWGIWYRSTSGHLFAKYYENAATEADARAKVLIYLIEKNLLEIK